MVRRELLSLSLYSLLASNRGGLFIVFFPLYLVEVKGSTLAAALVVLSIAYVPASLLGPLVGRLSDRLGRRRAFLLAGEAMAFPLFLAITFAPGWVLASALFVGAELALAIGGPAYTAYVADVTDEGERGEAYGLLNATSSAGAVVGFVLAGVVTFEFGLAALFPLVVAVMVGTISVVFFLVPDTRVAPSPQRRPLREMGPVATFSVAVSVRAIGSGAVATFYGYLAASLGANDCGGKPRRDRRIADRRPRLGPSRPADRPSGEIQGIWYGTLLTLGSYGVFAFATEWVETIPGQAVRNGGLSLVGPGMQAWVARAAPAGHRAEYLGVFSLINSTMWSVGPLVGAVAILFGGYDGLFAMAVGTTVLSLVLMEFKYGEMGIRSRLARRRELGVGPTGPPLPPG